MSPSHTQDAALSLAALVEMAAKRLEAAGVSFGHGTTNARDEAAWLVLWRLGLPLDTDLGTDGEGLRAVTPEQRLAVDALLDERISTRKPAAYLTREAWLQGVPFYVDERVIVPRSLIAELLVDGSIDEWLDPATTAVLDLCTGNGSLAVLAAMVWPDVQVTGADISPDALAVAQINVERHGLHHRIALVQSDGMAAVAGPWDLILCNPPYVNSASMAALPAEYKAEPSIALAGGTDGMDFVRPLLRDAARALTPSGVLLLEIGHEREHFEAAFAGLPVFWMDTSAGSDQVVLITSLALTRFFATA
ncbi:MAG: 50S ribosomal protein L3 N(5)-glutamine methyltransferase [Burkholderiaceae bacterium]